MVGWAAVIVGGGGGPAGGAATAGKPNTGDNGATANMNRQNFEAEMRNDRKSQSSFNFLVLILV